MRIDSQYDIEWSRQSRHSGETMPVGGYDTGLNIWVENGEVLFYIDRSGCLDENNQMLKPGRVRISFSPNPLAPEAKFSQTLKLRDGRVEIAGRLGDCELKLIAWLETHRPVIHIDAHSSRPVQMTAAYENWRSEHRELSAAERMAAVSWYSYPGSVTTKPDCVSQEADRVVFYHRNAADALLFDRLVEQQGLTAVKSELWNPQLDLTFGGCMFGERMRAGAAGAGSYAGTAYRSWTLVSEAAATEHRLYVCLHTDNSPDSADWRRGLDELSQLAAADQETAQRQALQWWHAYWQRSYIVIDGDRACETAAAGDDEGRGAGWAGSEAERPGHAQGWEIGRNYQLFRYMLGCNAYGDAPTKFNGGLFTSDPRHVEGSPEGAGPDYRRWGGGSLVAQNQRLLYWPLLKSGDFDMMAPQFEAYRKALGNAELRTRYYWGHEGCSFAEQVENFGLPIGWGWGWDGTDDKTHTRPRLFDPTELIGPWIRYQYSGQLEMAYMILQYYRFTNEDITAYMPFIESAVRFYDAHYQWRHEANSTHRLDEQGKLVIFPSTACESYKDAANPTDAVAGLDAVVRELLALPETLLAAGKRHYYAQLLERIPPIAYRDREGVRTIAPAHFWTHIINCELPHLYPVFPYGQYGVGRDDLQTAVDTWHYGADHDDQKNFISWHQDPIFCARLGLAEEAADQIALKLGNGPQRFPAFWGPGHDWLPDHNWGGSGMIALQDMLLQDVDGKIYLFPAWPEEWDVDFRLHAAYGTTVEGRLKDGKLAELKVEPAGRVADIVNLLGKGENV